MFVCSQETCATYHSPCEAMKSVRLLVPGLAPLSVGAILMVAVVGMACLDATADEAGNPGVSADQVLFGQSAAFSGRAQELGDSMRLGIEAAFHEVNQAGGVHGRMLELKTSDDRYEPGYAVQSTKWLIEQEGVFALIGAVGTPTTRMSSPIAQDAGVPFIAPFTGAEFLRDPALDTVLNLRASYHQETEEIIARLTEDLGITRIGVFYQDDAFGQDGLAGVRMALQRRGMEPVGAWHYERNTGAVIEATLSIIEANPEAVIMIGTQDAVATTIKLVNRDIRPVFVTISFVGGNALAKSLEEEGEGVYATQVVPFPEDGSIPVVARYHAALANYSPEAEPGFVSLEGYLAGRLAIFGLEACGPELSRQCFINALHTSDVIDIDGFQLKYGPNDNQGSDSVFLTVIGPDGKYRQANKLSAGR